MSAVGEGEGSARARRQNFDIKSSRPFRGLWARCIRPGRTPTPGLPPAPLSGGEYLHYDAWRLRLALPAGGAGPAAGRAVHQSG